MTLYEFFATYHDQDNDPPLKISVYIDDVEYVMKQQNPADTNYVDGAVFAFKTRLDEGLHMYLFEAYDGMGLALFPTDGSSMTLPVADYIDVVDDFENYIFEGTMWPSCPYYDVLALRHYWHDRKQIELDQSCTFNPAFETGSTISLGTDELHGQVLACVYDNNDVFNPLSEPNVAEQHYSEIVLEFAAGKDFTVLYQAAALGISFKGHPDNEVNEVFDRMYVGLEDIYGYFSVVEHPDANAIKKGYWQQWNISFGDFFDYAFVDLQNIRTLFIGFGQRGNPQSGPEGGEGTVLFDDIRLYPPRCIPEEDTRSPDITGIGGLPDCTVNYLDLMYLAKMWLSDDLAADLNEDNIVNLQDFAIVAYSWQAEILWP